MGDDKSIPIELIPNYELEKLRCLENFINNEGSCKTSSILFDIEVFLVKDIGDEQLKRGYLSKEYAYRQVSCRKRLLDFLCRPEYYFS